MKIFEFNKGQKGTLIDSVSKTALTYTLGNGKFVYTEKNKALKFDGADTDIYIPEVTLEIKTNSATIEFWYKKSETSSDNRSVLGSSAFAFYRNLRINSDNIELETNTASDFAKGTLIYNDTNWHHYIIESINGVVTMYQDMQLMTMVDNSVLNNLTVDTIGSAGRSIYYLNGTLASLQLFSTSLSLEEKNILYQKYLQASPTEKPTRNLEYPKPTDLSYESGLVAAYSFSKDTVSNGTLLDISGNGNNGTINGAISTKDGMSFNGINNNISLSQSLSLGTVHSSSYRFKLANISDGFICLVGSNSGSRYLAVIYPSSSTLYYRDGVNSTSIPFSPVDLLEHSLTITRNGTNIKFYLDGNLIGDRTNATNGNMDGIYSIGTFQETVYYFNGQLNDTRIYNRELSAQDAKAYHNSFVKPYLILDFSDEGVGNTSPKGWQVGTGAYEVKELASYVNTSLVIGTKYIECTSNGTISISYNQTDEVDASIDYYNGSTWTNYTDTLENLISTHSWLSLSGGYLTFTLTSGDRIANIEIKDGVEA